MNIDNIADDEWEWYIGQIFSRIIEKTCDYPIKSVVEIAPGFRYKIAYALSNINFEGTLYIIDTNKDVLEYVKKKYKTILPKSEIVCINAPFENSFNLVPNKIDLLVSNHCIDDMIISEYMDNYYDKNLNESNFKNILVDAWKNLRRDEKKAEEISNHVYNVFKDFINNKNITNIIISQYKSNLYFKDQSEDMDEITEKCFNKIKTLIKMDEDYINKVLEFYPFGDDERYLGKYLLENTQNAKNWIVGNIL